MEQQLVSVYHVEAVARSAGRTGRQVVGVADDELDVADTEFIGQLACLADHLRFAVHADDAPRRHPLGQVNGDGAGAAAHVQHVDTRPEMTK